MREAKAASTLNHPHMITIYEVGQIKTEAGQAHYIATEFIQGVTLRERMAKEKLTLPEGLKILLQIAAALEAAHEAGIVHRDIKPENIMIRPDGLVKVLDFGLAKLTEPRWLPDGRLIAFDFHTTGNADIHVIRAERGKPRRLMTEPTNEALPSWSRDGVWIYFCSACNSSNQHIWKLPTAGGQAVQVTQQGGFEAVRA